MTFEQQLQEENERLRAALRTERGYHAPSTTAHKRIDAALAGAPAVTRSEPPASMVPLLEAALKANRPWTREDIERLASDIAATPSDTEARSEPVKVRDESTALWHFRRLAADLRDPMKCVPHSNDGIAASIECLCDGLEAGHSDMPEGAPVNANAPDHAAFRALAERWAKSVSDSAQEAHAKEHCARELLALCSAPAPLSAAEAFRECAKDAEEAALEWQEDIAMARALLRDVYQRTGSSFVGQALVLLGEKVEP